MSEADPSPRKPRRRLAITLRVLMLLVLVIAVGLGWKVNRARVQRQAVVESNERGALSATITHTHWWDRPGLRPGYEGWSRSR